MVGDTPASLVVRSLALSGLILVVTLFLLNVMVGTA